MTTGLCVALLDLDFFKRINDQFGHDVGDDVLKVTADALNASIREIDFTARLGGDEFGILLAEVTSEQAAVVCERIRGQSSAD